MSLLAVDGVRRRFAGREVVDTISFALEAGENVALMGPSGCGKTTLLQMIGLLDRPDGGQIRIAGVTPWNETAATRAELRLVTLGFVFQHSNLIDHLTARENVALPAWRAGMHRRAALQRADELLAPLGLAPRASALARELSIGEAQRVAVARALVNRPKLVLADEPTGALDAGSARAVLAALFDVARTAVLVVTHDPEVAARAGRTLRMRDGKLAEAA
ncbi:MAG TPA: ABC transporter ATP-binding protein [Kofleriaceae bacterium]|nr:ABC transporter ATP-binding protein [Kofleriaceae bacterium]